MDGNLVTAKFRREDVPEGEIWVWNFTDWIKPTVAKGLCCNNIAGCCRANILPAGMVTVEIVADEKQTVSMGYKDLIYV